MPVLKPLNMLNSTNYIQKSSSSASRESKLCDSPMEDEEMLACHVPLN